MSYQRIVWPFQKSWHAKAFCRSMLVRDPGILNCLLCNYQTRFSKTAAQGAFRTSTQHVVNNRIRTISTNTRDKNSPCCGCLAHSESPWLYRVHLEDDSSDRSLEKNSIWMHKEWKSKFELFILKVSSTASHCFPQWGSFQLHPSSHRSNQMPTSRLLEDMSIQTLDTHHGIRSVNETKSTESDAWKIESLPDKEDNTIVWMTSDGIDDNGDVNAALEKIYTKLGDSLGNFFISWPEFSMYNKHLVFENSVFGFYTRGLTPYKFQALLFRQLSRVFLANPELRVLKITRNPESRDIRIRWQVTGTPRYLRILRRSHTLRYYDFFSVLRVGMSREIEFHLLMRVTPSRNKQGRTRLAKFFGLFGLAERLVHPGEIHEEPVPVVPSSTQPSYERTGGLGSC